MTHGDDAIVVVEICGTPFCSMGPLTNIAERKSGDIGSSDSYSDWRARKATSKCPGIRQAGYSGGKPDSREEVVHVASRALSATVGEAGAASADTTCPR